MKHAIGLFRTWQPEYASRGIATFPVRISADDKRPAVKHYKKVGLPGSAQLAMKFENDNAFGFMVGDRTKLTILDVDTPDERVLTRALDRHGHSPIIVRTGSGKFHAYFRHNDEHRLIRPWPDRPIDLLGAGFVVAPPSSTEKGTYQFIQGNLDDLDRLPVLRDLDLPKVKGAKEGERGDKLIRHLMKAAPHVDDFDSLLDVGRTFNDNCEPPMEDYKVISTARSAWGYEQRGENWFGRRKAYLPLDGVEDWTGNVDAFFLLAYLRKHQGRTARFWIANGLADRLGWPIRRLVNARRRLIQTGAVRPLTKPSQGRPVVYVWGESTVSNIA